MSMGIIDWVRMEQMVSVYVINTAKLAGSNPYFREFISSDASRDGSRPHITLYVWRASKMLTVKKF